MSFTLQPIRVATGFDEEGMMFLDEKQRLVAVLVRLADENEVAPGDGTWRQASAGSMAEAIRSSPTWTWQRIGSASASQGDGKRLPPEYPALGFRESLSNLF